MVLVVDELKQKLREIALQIEELRRDVMALERQQAPSTSSSEPTEPVRNQSSSLVVASGTDRMPTAFLISPGTSIAGASTSSPGRTACAGPEGSHSSSLASGERQRSAVLPSPDSGDVEGLV